MSGDRKEEEKGRHGFIQVFLPGRKLDSTNFSTCIICFAFLWFCCSVLFGSGSLNVKVKLYSYIYYIY